MTEFLLLFSVAYGVASVNVAVVLFKFLGRDDPRTRFSGNPGVTNVYRTAGAFWAAVVLLLDMGRAMAVAAAALHFMDKGLVPWIGVALILGNRYPCFHRFRGGKGVATFLGFTAIPAPAAAGVAALGWLLVFAACRIPFIASFFMVAILGGGTIMVCNYQFIAIVGTLAAMVMIYLGHGQNISMMMRRKGRGGK